MILLVDTDMLIDFALDRRPHAVAAGELLDALERRQATGFIAWHGVANFHYLVVSKKGSSATKAFLLDLLRFVQVAPTSTESVRYAASLSMRDFEDALQVAAAVACGVDDEGVPTRRVIDHELGNHPNAAGMRRPGTGRARGRRAGGPSGDR